MDYVAVSFQQMIQLVMFCFVETCVYRAGPGHSRFIECMVDSHPLPLRYLVLTPGYGSVGYVRVFVGE